MFHPKALLLFKLVFTSFYPIIQSPRNHLEYLGLTAKCGFDDGNGEEEYHQIPIGLELCKDKKDKTAVCVYVFVLRYHRLVKHAYSYCT